MTKEWDAPWKYTINQHGFSDGGDRRPAPSFSSSRNPPACACATPRFDDVGHRVSDMQGFQNWSSLWLQEALRVLEPGGTLKAFGGTRVFHRLAAAMEDVGFLNIRMEAWNYGSGFPKSLNLAKALDRHFGKEPVVVAEGVSSDGVRRKPRETQPGGGDRKAAYVPSVTRPSTEEAARWDGWGTALKPSWEPVLVGMKPSVG